MRGGLEGKEEIWAGFGGDVRDGSTEGGFQGCWDTGQRYCSGTWALILLPALPTRTPQGDDVS